MLLARRLPLLPVPAVDGCRAPQGALSCRGSGTLIRGIEAQSWQCIAPCDTPPPDLHGRCANAASPCGTDAERNATQAVNRAERCAHARGGGFRVLKAVAEGVPRTAGLGGTGSARGRAPAGAHRMPSTWPSRSAHTSP